MQRASQHPALHPPSRQLRQGADKCGRLFLCHLYSAEHYSCAPYPVDSRIDPTAEPPPTINLSWPKLDTFKKLKQATTSTLFQSESPVVCTGLLSLCHHFDCAALLSRVEDNMLLVVAEDSNYDNEFTATWLCLLTADKFDLQRVKQACIAEQAAQCCSDRYSPCGESKQWWQETVQALHQDTLIELLQAICTRARQL